MLMQQVGMCRSTYGPYLSLGGGEALDLALYGGVGAPRVATQQSLAVHLGLEAGDVAAAEVFAEVAHLLQLQQVDPQHLDGLHHLQVRHTDLHVISRCAHVSVHADDSTRTS